MITQPRDQSKSKSPHSPSRPSTIKQDGRETPAPQLDLFGDPQVRGLRAEVEWLRGRLDTAKTEYRKLRDAAAAEQARLEHIVAVAIRERDAVEHQARLYKASADLAQLVQQAFPASGPSTTATERVFKQLLALAHPDKWSQGQPATELAHEITVTVNGMRERLGVQP